ncbi:MAG: hypothetical protein Q8K18_11255 [Burkholderiales bacterium]|nr:hypothetical protein [Burkholderiales bacterium]
MAATDKPNAPSQPEDYGMEVLCASWNPAATAVAETLGRASHQLPADLSGTDVDAFLKQFYRCQKS